MEYERLPYRTHDLDAHQKSLDYVRWLSCCYDQGGPLLAGRAFLARFPRAIHRDLVEKAAVTAGGMNDATWAAPLAPIQPLMEAFLSYSRPLSLLGKIPGLRRVPFNCSLPLLTAPTLSGWVGEGTPKPITSGSFATVLLTSAKAVDIIVLTDELLRLATPGSDVALRAELAASIAMFLDRQFIDPAVVAVAGMNPASVTNGLTPITPSGTTNAAVVVDVDKLIGQFLTQNPDTSSAVLLMTPSVASMLVSATKSQTLTINGGSYAGVPVVVSGNVGTRIVMLDPTAILVADDDGVVIDMSRQGTVQLDSAPDNPALATTVLTSLWQSNLVALRAERFVSWKRSRTSAVALVSPTNYTPGT